MPDSQNISEVIIERRGSAGLIRLNRPRALNSLTLPMVQAIATALDEFATDEAIVSVIISGEGERGFCAGGDIRALHESGTAGNDLAERFWREEFHLNHRIANYPKPYVALMDGITMGGGVGLSSHGRHRVVTERTRLAMPETGIGYFPDVGATWLLPRCPSEIGTWMGLTGKDVGAADAIHAGLADICVDSRLPDVIAALADLPFGSNSEDVAATLDQFAIEAATGPLAANAALIARCFSLGSVNAILAALAEESCDFAAETRRTISTRSPTSLKLTLRLLHEGDRSETLAKCLNRELGAGQQILRTPDFYEGIRAAVIDKDRNPKWSPDTLAGVDDAMIERFFQPLDKPLAL